jgi:tetratricopeptide (TPR) repeat protein
MTVRLFELVPLIQRYVPNHRELLQLLTEDHPTVWKLYDLLGEKHIQQSDLLQEESGLSDAAFKQCERLLLDTLRKMLGFAEFHATDVDPFVIAFLDGYKKIAHLKMLRLMGARHNADDIAREVQRIGEKYDNPVLVYFGADALCDLAAGAIANEKDFSRWRDQCREAKQHMDIEQVMRAYYHETQMAYLHSREARPKASGVIDQRLAEMEGYFGRVASNNFELHYLLARIQQHLSQLQYEAALQTVETSIRHFNNKPYPLNSIISALQLQKVACCIMLRRFDEGRDAAEKALSDTPEDTPNWYQALMAYFYLAMHTRQYDEAALIYRRGLNNRRLRLQPEHVLSQWRLLGAYLYIALSYTGKNLEQYDLPKIRSTRLVNDVPAFTQDKRGMNVAILIAHILIQLLEGKYDDMRQRTGALEKYGARYLRNDDSLFRSNAFIKILGLLPAVSFRKRYFLQKATPLFERMRTVPLEMARQTHELEIMPYEDLWLLLQNKLDERAH